MAVVTVRHLRASNLPSRDIDGSDPYVELVNGRLMRRTRAVFNDNNPVWSEEFTFTVSSPYLQVAVWDFDGKDRPAEPLGHGSVTLTSLRPGAQEVTVDLDGPGTLTMELVMPDQSHHSHHGDDDCHPTDAELQSLSAACTRLWNLDDNRVPFGSDLDIDLQQRATLDGLVDRAENPLFKQVSPQIFEKPTFKALKALLDNYEADVGSEEVVTAQEMKEIEDFLDAIIQTRPMKYCQEYLTKKGHVGPSTQAFRGFLNGLWFDLYGRGARRDTCGFEHVFCGEQRAGAVIGFHNWVKFWVEEKAGRVDYRGYATAPKQGGLDEDPRLIAIKFGWEDDAGVPNVSLPVKSVSSMFIGSSPEFEMALYTLCFVEGVEENKLKINGYDVNIVCHRMQRAGRTFIGTIYPVGSW